MFFRRQFLLDPDNLAPVALCAFVCAVLAGVLLRAHVVSAADNDPLLRMRRYLAVGSFDAPIAVCGAPRVRALGKPAMDVASPQYVCHRNIGLRVVCLYCH